ncbi:ABC transporter substrate-binding protein [Ferrovibrio sp.]|uniref:ABC transporter substrate-binding protein n=1 Tax=Ferrovibrio sp. TaxID=1917215 RepID=UPI003D281955
MSKQDNKRIGRRAALKTLGGGAAAAAFTLGGAPWNFAIGQSQRTVRIWTTQSAPAQIKVYDTIIKMFEAKNPKIKIALELVSDDDVFPKLTAAHAAGQPPEICSNTNTYVPGALHGRGLVENMADVAKAVGDFTPRSLEVYNEGGFQFSLGAALTVISAMWVRTDLFAAEGLDVPKHWDDYLVAAKKLTKRGVYGTALPYGKGAFANRMMDMFIRQAGGDIVAPDMSVVFDNPGTHRALEFMAEARAFAPPGANNYSFGETLNAFVSGATAIGVYSGRTLSNIHAQNPSLKDKVKAAFYSYPRDGQRYWVCGYDAFFINKGAKVNTDEAKIFAEFFYQPEPYTLFLHGAPAHNLPVVDKVARSATYNDNPVLNQHKADIDTLMAIAAEGWVNIKPTAKHPFIFKMGDIYGSNIMAEVLQRVVVEKQTPKAAAAWGQDRIAEIMKA